MPGKYEIEVTFTLTTEATPDGYLTGVEDEVLDYEESHSWYTDTMRADGGTISFQIEADSEDEARERVSEIMGFAAWGGDSLEWEVSDWSISEIVEIEPPMDLVRATEIIRSFLTRIREMGGVTADEEVAFNFLLDHITP